MVYMSEKPYGMPREEDWTRFLSLRADVFKEIARQLEIDGHCKSYEGCFEISFPNYFDEAGRRAGRDDFPPNTHVDDWGITLHCYLLGPGRHHTWTGDSFEQCLDRCEPEIRKWISEAQS